MFYNAAASSKAEVVSKKASESKQMASELSSAAKSLSVKLTDTKDRLAQKEQVATSDSESALLVRKPSSLLPGSKPNNDLCFGWRWVGPAYPVACTIKVLRS